MTEVFVEQHLTSPEPDNYLNQTENTVICWYHVLFCINIATIKNLKHGVSYIQRQNIGYRPLDTTFTHLIILSSLNGINLISWD